MNQLSNLPAYLLAAFLAVCLLVDLRRSIYRLLAGRSIVLVSVAYWYLIEALRIPKELDEYSQGEYNFGLFCVALSVVAFLVGYHSSRLSLFGPLARRLIVLDNTRVVWALMLAGMAIGFGSLLVYVDFDFWAFFEGLSGLKARWSGTIARGRYGSWRTILYELQMFLQATMPLAVCLAFTKRAPTVQRLVAALFLVWLVLYTISAGARAPLIPIFLCLGAAVFWRASPRLRRTLILCGVVPALVGAYFLAALIVAGRNEGKFDSEAALNVDYVGVEMFRELLFTIRAEQKGMPPQYGLTYFTQLVNPIPRAIWPGKPVGDAGLILAVAYGAVDAHGEPTMTISPGFLGEAYLNFALLGLLIVPAFAGMAVRSWDHLLALASTSFPIFLVYATGLATFFASGRSVNFATFYGLIALFVLLILFEKLGLSRSGGGGEPRHLPFQGRSLRSRASV